MACELFNFQSVATFLPEGLQRAAEGVFETAKGLNEIFEPCQIILGDCQDRECHVCMNVGEFSSNMSVRIVYCDRQCRGCYSGVNDHSGGN